MADFETFDYFLQNTLGVKMSDLQYEVVKRTLSCVVARDSRHAIPSLECT